MIESKCKLLREPGGVSMDLLYQAFGLDPIQFGQVGVEHDLLTTNEENSGGDGFDGNWRKGFGHRLLEDGGISIRKYGLRI
jgi:hypothetical protein